MALLPRRTLYFLFIVAVIGLIAGVLTYSMTPKMDGAFLAGLLAAGAALGFLLSVDVPAIATWHGAGLSLVSTTGGALVGWLFCLNQDAPIAGGVLFGAPVAAAVLLFLQKYVP